MTQYIAELTSLPPHICLLILAAAVLGLFAGLAIALLAILIPNDQQKKKPARKSSQARQWISPKRYRKESERRATNRALMQVASTAITLPTRR